MAADPCCDIIPPDVPHSHAHWGGCADDDCLGCAPGGDWDDVPAANLVLAALRGRVMAANVSLYVILGAVLRALRDAGEKPEQILDVVRVSLDSVARTDPVLTEAARVYATAVAGVVTREH